MFEDLEHPRVTASTINMKHFGQLELVLKFKLFEKKMKTLE